MSVFPRSHFPKKTPNGVAPYGAAGVDPDGEENRGPTHTFPSVVLALFLVVAAFCLGFFLPRPVEEE
jgi:hypothetical protein